VADEPFTELDYVYTPTRAVAPDVRYLVDVLGARLVFAIDAMGTRVALLRLTDRGPALVLADHLDGDRPILVYRVDDLEATAAALATRGWSGGHRLEIPQGPVRSFTAPGGLRIAIYELTRPGVVESFEGRRDF
jgi:hypothetical protein